MPIEQPPSTGANTVRLFFSLGVMTIGVAATLATILGFFGSAWWAFDLIAGYRVQLAVILLLAAAGFRIGFGFATGALFLAAAITNIVIVFPLFFASHTEANAGEGTLVVASVPVEETGKEEALRWVESSGVDIAFLLDTDDTWAGIRPSFESGYRTVDQIFLGRQTGLTIIARDGLEVTTEEIDNISNPLVRTETKIGDNDIALYALLLPSPGSDTEARQRNLLLEDLGNRISTERMPVAVIGGLGASQWSHAFRVLAGKGNLKDSSPGNGFQGSSPGSIWIGFRTPTHHLLHSDDLTTVGRHLGPDLGHGQRILEGTIALSAG